MKVVHINTYDGNGGAGRAVLRLNKGLQLLGADSRVVCLYQFDPGSGVKAVSHTFSGKLRAVFNIFAERYLVKPFLKNSEVPFSLQRFGVSPSGIEAIRDADIVHLHWVNHGFLSPEGIGDLGLLNKKMFWSLHDSNPITGGCHVRYGCQHFRNECGNCPVLKKPSPADLSHRTWLKKKRAYGKLDVTFIAPSSWMGERAREASLTGDLPVRVISNALETDVFRPLDKAACRREFEIDEHDQVILAGYMPSKSDKHKGLAELTEAIAHLANSPGIEMDRLLLLFYGSNGEGIDWNVPVRHRFMGRIGNDDTLVKLYNLSDVFLFPSLEESMGYTALESLSCGTPVVAFNTSGVTDVVKHGINGYLAETFDTKDLAHELASILNNSGRAELSQAARTWADGNFNLKTIAQQHLDLYREALS